MKVLIGSMITGSILAIAAFQAVASIAQPFKVLSNVYGHTAEISEGVASGSYRGIDVSEQNIDSRIDRLPYGDTKNDLKSLQEIYGGLEQLNQ